MRLCGRLATPRGKPGGVQSCRAELAERFYSITPNDSDSAGNRSPGRPVSHIMVRLCCKVCRRQDALYGPICGTEEIFH